MAHDFVQNFPLFCIILTLFSGPCCMILRGKWARIVNLGVISAVGVMSLAVLVDVCARGAMRSGWDRSKHSWHCFFAL